MHCAASAAEASNETDCARAGCSVPLNHAKLAIGTQPILGIDNQLGEPALRSRPAPAAGPRPVRKYPPICAVARLAAQFARTTREWMI